MTNQIQQIKTNLATNLLLLGELLSEAKANEYPQLQGFETFADWLESSGLDMSERQAYYLIKIVDNAKFLGIEQKTLEGVKMSKLKEIFSLDPVKHGQDIQNLLTEAPNLKLNDLRNRVNDLRSEVGLEPTSWCNFRLTDSQYEQVKTALETARMEYGQVVTEGGEVLEASDGTLLADVICNGYLQSVTDDDKQRREFELNQVIDAEEI